MKCKYCGKETTGEICDDCVAKLAHRNAGNTESTLNTATENTATEKPAMSSYFAANYGKKGAISSFVCGIIGIIVAYVAVFFAALYRQALMELDKATDSVTKNAIQSLIGTGNAGAIISLIACAALGIFALTYGIISIIRFIKTCKKGGKPVKTLVFGIIGCVLAFIALSVCMTAFGYYNGTVPLPAV